uniref:Uncharacterized protein n=1 Tax=Oryza brachyantha TaxID=4533 RepID=J3NAD2_ORYBR
MRRDNNTILIWAIIFFMAALLPKGRLIKSIHRSLTTLPCNEFILLFQLTYESSANLYSLTVLLVFQAMQKNVHALGAHSHLIAMPAA